MPIEAVQEMERRLREAMLGGDVAALDELLGDGLVFVDQAGRRLGKDDDLAHHRSGLLTIGALRPSDERIRVVGGGTVAIVNVTVAVEGRYADAPFAGTFAYTRLWCQEDGRWRVKAAHCSAVA